MIIKHANPCGAAVGETWPTPTARRWLATLERLRRHRRLRPAARRRGRGEIARVFTEVVVARRTRRRERCFAAKPDLRLLTLDAMPAPVAAGHDFKWLSGGFSSRTATPRSSGRPSSRSHSRRAPTSGAGRPAVRLDGGQARQVQRDRARPGPATVGIGMGQTSRLTPCTWPPALPVSTPAAAPAWWLGRVLPLPRRPRRRRRGGRHRRDPAQRQPARPRGDRRPRTRPASRWYSPASATSGTEPANTRNAAAGPRTSRELVCPPFVEGRYGLSGWLSSVQHLVGGACGR